MLNKSLYLFEIIDYVETKKFTVLAAKMQLFLRVGKEFLYILVYFKANENPNSLTSKFSENLISKY